MTKQTDAEAAMWVVMCPGSPACKAEGGVIGSYPSESLARGWADFHQCGADERPAITGHVPLRPMSPSERLTAAADKLQEHLDAASSTPWSAEERNSWNDWVSIRNGHITLASVVAVPDANLAILAVNAMPVIVRALRVEARTIECSPDYRADSTIAALADQILGGQR